MGQDKALIEVDGVPLLRRTCEVAVQSGASTVYVVTPRVEAYRPILPGGCELVEESRSPDGLPHGPLVGFAQGLAAAQMAQMQPGEGQPDWVLLLACDLPRLDAEILRRWQGQLGEMEDTIALLPRGEKGWEPLCGFYRRDCLLNLTEFIDQGGRSFQKWLAQATVQAIAFHPDPAEHHREQAMLFNCNTPADLEHCSEP
jgi:molybdenum cofactor guanylyltransferase